MKIPSGAHEAFVTSNVGFTKENKKVQVWTVDIVDKKDNILATHDFLTKREAWELACKVNREELVEGMY